MVEKVISDEDVPSLEIPYYLVQISVPANSVTSLVIIMPTHFLLKV